jgi:hypothetical protein
VTNRYSGKCAACAKVVRAGEGILVPGLPASWAVYHVPCAIGSDIEVADDLAHADAFERDGAAFVAKQAVRKVVRDMAANLGEPVATRQTAWYDETDYVVPSRGLSAEQVRSALYDLWTKPVIGGLWAVGGYSTPRVSDNGDGTLTVTSVYHIGD